MGQGCRDIDPGQKRKVVGRITPFSAHLNNCGVVNPDGGGDKDIVEAESEQESAEPVEGHRMSMIGILQSKGVQQRGGVQSPSFYPCIQLGCAFEKLDGSTSFSGIEIAHQDKRVRK